MLDWQDVPLNVQNMCIVAITLACPIGLAVVMLRGYAPWVLVRSLLVRHRRMNIMLAGIIAMSLALTVALTSQERALRVASAQAAKSFDLIVAAPGSPLDMTLATVYLKTVQAELLGGRIMQKLTDDPRVLFAAPIAFGDVYNGAPVVGSTKDFVRNMTQNVFEGRCFKSLDESVVGAKVDLEIGDTFVPEHAGADEDTDDDHHHEKRTIRIVGRMQSTGSPWDRAIIVPVESMWKTHGLLEESHDDHGHDDHHVDHGHDDHGHDDHDDHHGHVEGKLKRIGPPFDVDHFPGTQAIFVRSQSIAHLYALKEAYTGPDSMAFFPGTVLAHLHAQVHDMRMVMEIITLSSQAFVFMSILVVLLLIAMLSRQRFAALRALGAPKRFIYVSMWLYIITVSAVACGSGLLLGQLVTMVLSEIISQRTDLMVRGVIGWHEVKISAFFFTSIVSVSLLALVPIFRRPVVELLREE